MEHRFPQDFEYKLPEALDFVTTIGQLDLAG
jgi:hypothetical protein